MLAPYASITVTHSAGTPPWQAAVHYSTHKPQLKLSVVKLVHVLLHISWLGSLHTGLHEPWTHDVEPLMGAVHCTPHLPGMWGRVGRMGGRKGVGGRVVSAAGGAGWGGEGQGRGEGHHSSYL